eukprot:54204-Alexandrium_andersonii.AAC.1
MGTAAAQQEQLTGQRPDLQAIVEESARGVQKQLAGEAQSARQLAFLHAASPSEAARLRSQAGPGASQWLARPRKDAHAMSDT